MKLKLIRLLFKWFGITACLAVGSLFLFAANLPIAEAIESDKANSEFEQKQNALNLAKAMKWAWKTGYGTGKYVASNSVPVTDEQAWELSPVVSPVRKMLAMPGSGLRINP